MAIGGKTLGIVSGLAVGVTSGVLLAALNPIVPKTGSVVEAPSAEQVADVSENETSSEPALPKLSMVETAPEAEPELESEVVSEPVEDEVAVATQEPAVEQEFTSKPPETSEPASLDAASEPDTQLALVLPENSQSGGVDAAPDLPLAVENDAQPSVSNEPAAAIELAEPTLETEGPDVNVAQPVANEAVETATVVEPELSAEPNAPASDDTVVAALPKIEDPVAPIEVAAVIEEPKIAPNTSGTFKTTGGSLITQGSSLPKIGETSETGLGTLGTGTKSSRFKTIGDSAKITEPSAETGAETDVGALVRNANEFPVLDEPLLSVILIDDGKIAAQLPSLQGLNLPLSIAVSLDDVDAAERAAQYRNAGFEVLAMTPRNVSLSLSGGQTNEQVAGLLTQYFDILPNSIGLIDRPSANLQKDQRLTRAVVKHFGKTGHGLVTYAGGLNSSKRIAEQEGVSSGAVFRFLDKSGEAGPIITQQLDRAAREARKSGSVIVMATASKATLGTLVSS